MANVKTSNKESENATPRKQLGGGRKSTRKKSENWQTKSLLGLWTESRTGSELRFIGLTHKDSLKII